MPLTVPEPKPTLGKGPSNLSLVPGRPSLGTSRPKEERGGESERHCGSPPTHLCLVSLDNLVQNGDGPYGRETAGAGSGMVDNLAGIDLRVKSGQMKVEEHEETGLFCHARTRAPAGALPARLFPFSEPQDGVDQRGHQKQE